MGHNDIFSIFIGHTIMLIGRFNHVALTVQFIVKIGERRHFNFWGLRQRVIFFECDFWVKNSSIIMRLCRVYDSLFKEIECKILMQIDYEYHINWLINFVLKSNKINQKIYWDISKGESSEIAEIDLSLGTVHIWLEIHTCVYPFISFMIYGPHIISWRFCVKIFRQMALQSQEIPPIMAMM